MSFTDYDPNKHYDPDKNPTLEYMWGRAWGAGRGWWGHLGNERFERENPSHLKTGQHRPVGIRTGTGGGSVLGAAIPLVIIVWLVFSGEPPERRSSESREASQHAIAPVTGHKEIRVSDAAGLQASHHMPVIVTGTVARVVKNDLGGDGSSFALELFFAETDNVFVYVIPMAAPEVEARFGTHKLVGQQVAIRQDRLFTNISPIRLGVGAVDEIEVR